ncbi:MAG: hypothetical protein WCS22_02440 [Acholeplasmataceae bacterium]
MKVKDKVIINGKEAIIKDIKKDRVLVEICTINSRGVREKRLQWYTKDMVWYRKSMNSETFLNDTKTKNVEFGIQTDNEIKENRQAKNNRNRG